MVMCGDKRGRRASPELAAFGLLILAAASLAACQSSQAARPGGNEERSGGPGGGQGMPPGPPPGGRSASVERGAQPGGAGRPEKPAAESGLLAGRGGSSLLEIEGQSVACDFAADRSSSISIVLRGGASLTGSINADGAAKFASLVVEAGSAWIVSADSCLDSLSAEIGADGKSVVNIKGNGHRVRYDAKANPGLGGKSYQLAGGGSLVPE